jgi:hypothetical protein
MFYIISLVLIIIIIITTQMTISLLHAAVAREVHRTCTKECRICDWFVPDYKSVILYKEIK